jgi:predicted TIM-barrel fold metal-dependent hydrolase
MIIDAHMHVDDLPALGWNLETELCIRRMDEAGIDAAVVMTISDWPEVNERSLEMIAEACAGHAGRLYGFARIHPWYGERAVNGLERAFSEYGFKGLKLHPVTTIAHPASAASIALIRKAAEHNAPTLFHCGDEPMTTPLAIAAAAAACPEATIILGHMGGYMHVDEAIEVAKRYPNVILETSAMPYPDKIAAAVRRIGPERVIYASDGPACSPRIEVEKIRRAQLEPSAEALVLAGNIRRLLDGVR